MTFNKDGFLERKWVTLEALFLLSNHGTSGHFPIHIPVF